MNPPDFKAPIEVIPGQSRILLSEAASRHLDTTGEQCFRIVCKAHLPDRSDRWLVILAPVPLSIARQAESILFGTHIARPIRKPATARSIRKGTANAAAPDLSDLLSIPPTGP